MRVYKKAGTKERLFEMFENVNKIKLNENSDSLKSKILGLTSKIRREFSNKYGDYIQQQGNAATELDDKVAEFLGFDSEFNMDGIDDMLEKTNNPSKLFDLYKYLQQVDELGSYDVYDNEFQTSMEGSMNEDAPAGYKVALRDVDPNDPNLINAYLPSTNNADGSEIVRSPNVIARWKEEFINKFGDEGILEKGRSLPHTFDLVGNDTYTQWSREGISSKSAALDQERSKGSNTMMDSYEPAMNEDDYDFPEVDSLRYKYDGKGNYIPVGHEDKRVGLRSIEKPIGSGNWKIGVVELDENGEYVGTIALKNSWEEGRNAIYDALT